MYAHRASGAYFIYVCCWRRARACALYYFIILFLRARTRTHAQARAWTRGGNFRAQWTRSGRRRGRSFINHPTRRTRTAAAAAATATAILSLRATYSFPLFPFLRGLIFFYFLFLMRFFFFIIRDALPHRPTYDSSPPSPSLTGATPLRLQLNVAMKIAFSSQSFRNSASIDDVRSV